MELTSITKFLATYAGRTDVQPENLDELDILTFAAETASDFQVDKVCDPMVSFLSIENYNARMPPRFKKIIECAYKDPLSHLNNPVLYHDEVISWTAKNFADCDVKITVECPKCHQHQCSCGDDSVVIRVDDEWLAANVERNYWDNPRYSGVYGLNKPGAISSFYHPQFTLMRPAQHKYSGASYHVRGCVNLDRRLKANAPVAYQMVSKQAGDLMRVNVEEGVILLAYLAKQYDDDGWPLVPDCKEVFDAIFWDVEAKILYKYKNKKKEYYQWAQNAEIKAEKHIGRAIEKITAITPQEWDATMRNLLKMVPYRNYDQQAGRSLTDRYDSFRNM